MNKTKTTLFALALAFFFTPSFALASTITIVSNETTMADGAPSVVLSFIHPDWTADLDGAHDPLKNDGTSDGSKWIWATDGPTSPNEEQTYVFEKTFTLDTAISSSTLYFAIDNRATVKLNGSIIAESPVSGSGFAKETEGVYVVPSSDFQIGENKLSVTAINDAFGSGLATDNPAGILYKLVMQGGTESLPFSGANGSFENGIDPGLFATLNAPDTAGIADWSVVSGGIDYIGTYWTASDGARSIDLNSVIAGSVSQSFPTVIGTTYEVTFDLSGNPDVFSDANNPYSPSAKVIEVNAGESTPKNFTYDTSAKGNSRYDMRWEKQTYTFVALGENTTITFASKTSGSFGPALDNVLITEKAGSVPILALTDANETEDDGIQDTKGVADKTEFTFSVTATGEPDSVSLFVDGNETILPRTALGEYATTSTFPKGVHLWRFEAVKGTQTVTTETKTFTTGYSNVAFLPGIKASRLFKYDCGNPDCEDQLWEPNKDADTLDIALNPDGSSVDTGIYVKTKPSNAVIDEGFYFTENIYKNFLKELKDWKADGIMNDYGVLAYDWRLAFPNILNQGDATIDGRVYYDDSFSTSTPYILQEIRKLAESSDTGKVTIIGHSMGGMLAKKLLIDNQDIASSTDTLILVDSPQLGTPQAIATMLHGTNEELDFPAVGWPDFTTQETVRLVAQNMKSVYTLLPSREYASRVENSGLGYATLFLQNENLRNITDDPLWNANSVLDFYQMKYGTTTITAYDGMRDFLGGADGHLSAPDNDIIHPKRIQMDMLAEAQAIHDEIDNWIPPETMRVVQIAGWGIPETIRGIEYKWNYHKKCSSGGMNTFCWNEGKFDVEPMFTFDGDGTVVLPSQMAMNTETYFVDLNEYNRENFFLFFDHVNRSHASILEVPDSRQLVLNIIKQTLSPLQETKHIKTDKTQLDKTKLKDLVRLSLHSPVNVDVYDFENHHVGLNGNIVENQLPNSYYLEMGEGKYLGFPLEASTTIKLQGTGTGTFTLNLEQYQGDTKEGTQTFTDIPVSTTTKAMLVINTLNDAKELALDQDGNGTVDSVVFTDENKETVTFQTLKTQIQTLTTKTKSVLLVEVAVAEKQFNKGNYQSTKALLLVLKKEIEVLSKQKIKNKWQIEKNDALRLFAILDALIEKVNMNIPKK
jgi:choice-of-anchor C domain-containing protein